MKRIGILFLFCLFWSEAVVLAEWQYKIVPSLSIVETYDDNIYRSSADKTSDLTTAIAPAISFDIRCPTKGITLNYSTPFVFYRRRTEHNTIRQGADLSAFHQVGPHTRVDFSDSFYRGEEPQEPDETIYATRRTRNPYYRNTGDVKTSHQFGLKDSFSFGYNDSHLENKDPEVEDTRIQTPYAGLSYWFDVQNGLELDVRHSIGDYEVTPDFKQYTGSVRLVHLFSQDSSISASYMYTDMNYDPGRTDYVVHDGKVSYGMTPWPNTTLSVGIGYYIYNPTNGDSDDRVSLDLGLDQTQRFERGSFSIGVKSGYRQELTDAENRGFARFWSANGRVSYFLLPYLTLSGAVDYMEERFIEQVGRLDTVWSATAGLAYSYRRWLSLSLNGQHTERDSSVDINDYDDNQIILRITASYN
jgi:hypothetical protein